MVIPASTQDHRIWVTTMMHRIIVAHDLIHDYYCARHILVIYPPSFFTCVLLCYALFVTVRHACTAFPMFSWRLVLCVSLILCSSLCLWVRDIFLFFLLSLRTFLCECGNFDLPFLSSLFFSTFSSFPPSFFVFNFSFLCSLSSPLSSFSNLCSFLLSLPFMSFM